MTNLNKFCNLSLTFVTFIVLFDGFLNANEGINITEIYEPVKKICEAFGFEQLNNVSSIPTESSATIRKMDRKESITNTEKIHIQRRIKLLTWTCEQKSGIYSLTISYSAPSYHDVVWQWRNREEPYSGFIPVLDGDTSFTSRTIYKDWYYQTSIQTFLHKQILIQNQYRISLVIVCGDQSVYLSFYPFSVPEFGKGEFNHADFSFYEYAESENFKIFHAEITHNNSSVYRMGIYGYFDWIEQTISSSGRTVMRPNSFLLQRSHITANPAGTMENYTLTNQSVNTDVYINRSLADTGGILRIGTWITGLNFPSFEYTYNFPVNGGYPVDRKACDGSSEHDITPEVIEGSTHALQCTCFGNPPPDMQITKDGRGLNEMNSVHFQPRKISFDHETRFIMVVRNVTKWNTGNFTCSGTVYDDVIETKFSIVYGEPTKVIENSANVKHLPHNQVLITFKVSGIPKPTISNCKYYTGYYEDEVQVDTYPNEPGELAVPVALIIPSDFVGTITCDARRLDEHVHVRRMENLFIDIETSVDDFLDFSVI